MLVFFQKWISRGGICFNFGNRRLGFGVRAVHGSFPFLFCCGLGEKKQKNSRF